MPSLSKADDRFGVSLKIIEGGSGTFRGILTEPAQGEAPSYQFNLPRRLLRVRSELPVGAGLVIRVPSGDTFMVGDHGSSEEGIFKSFRVFQVNGRFSWKRRSKIQELVSGLDQDLGLVAMPDIWGAYEPLPELFDRALRTNIEAGRFITTALVQRDDVVNDMKVSRVDIQLGLKLVTLG